MLNRSASLAMSTSVLKAEPGKLDIKRHSPSILYVVQLAARKKSIIEHVSVTEQAGWSLIWSGNAKTVFSPLGQISIITNKAFG